MPKKYMTKCSTSLSGNYKSKVQHIPSHSCLNEFYHKVINKCGWGCLENGGLNGLLGGMYIGATSMEYLLEVSHDISQGTVMRPLTHFCIYIHFCIDIQRKWNNCLKGNPYSHVHCIYIHSSLETTNYGNNLGICQQVKRLQQCDVIIYIYIWILFSHWKRKKFFHLWQHGWNWWGQC